MMRKYFENVTGQATGSDLNVNHYASIALQYTGLKAESICDSRAWIKKSHFPIVIPFQNPKEYDYVIICMRYEVDVMVSFFYPSLQFDLDLRDWNE